MSFIFMSTIGSLIFFFLIYEAEMENKRNVTQTKSIDIVSIPTIKEEFSGILAPSGTFYSCEPQEHILLAEKLCRGLYDKEKFDVYAEDYLLTKGFVFIKENGAYMSQFDSRGNTRTLTNMQINWINANAWKAEKDVLHNLTEILFDNDKRMRMGIRPFDNETDYLIQRIRKN